MKDNHYFEIVFFIVFFLAGCFVEYQMVQKFIATKKVLSWVKVPCTILDSKMSTIDSYCFQILYSYKYDGKEYVGSSYSLDEFKSSYASNVMSLVEKYPVSSTADCYVCPTRPFSAIIEQPKNYGKISNILFPLFFVVVGLTGFIYYLRKQFYRNRSDGWHVSGRNRSDDVFVYDFRVTIIFLMFALVGTWLLYSFSIKPLTDLYCAQSWVETPCKVFSSDIVAMGHRRVKYVVDILYKYTYAGKEYSSNVYSFNPGAGTMGSKRAVVNKYAKMTDQVCYVDPDKPGNSILNRKLNLGYLAVLFPLPFLLMGYGGLYMSVFKKQNTYYHKTNKRHSMRK